MVMNESKLNQPPVDARLEILELKHEIMRAGAVDSEGIQIDTILEDLAKKKITNEQALELTHAILERRQSYH